MPADLTMNGGDPDAMLLVDNATQLVKECFDGADDLLDGREHLRFRPLDLRNLQRTLVEEGCLDLLHDRVRQLLHFTT